MPDPQRQIAEVLRKMEESCRGFLDVIEDLPEAAWETRTDASGWTVKDHVIHAGKWAGSMVAVIRRQARWEAMGVSLELWATIVETYDQINEDIRRQYARTSPQEVLADFKRSHRSLVEEVEKTPSDLLLRPYAEFQELAETETEPLYRYILGNSAWHYDEHRGYIQEITKEWGQ